MAFSGRRLSAAEAERPGPVNRVETGGALATAVELADRITRAAPMSVCAAKPLFNRALGDSSLAHTRDATAALFVTDDAREGMAAVRQKRAPRFVGR